MTHPGCASRTGARTFPLTSFHTWNVNSSLSLLKTPVKPGNIAHFVGLTHPGWPVSPPVRRLWWLWVPARLLSFSKGHKFHRVISRPLRGITQELHVARLDLFLDAYLLTCPLENGAPTIATERWARLCGQHELSADRNKRDSGPLTAIPGKLPEERE